jgi:glycerol kinase
MSILAIDQGTSSTKAFVLEPNGEFKFVDSIVHRQIYPAPGWVEHEAEELARNVKSLIDQGLEVERAVAGIAIANQGETVVAWDRRTHKPLYNAVVWQDQRTETDLNSLSISARKLVTERSGLAVDPYFSGAKLAWLYKNVPAVRAVAQSGYLGLGTSDSFFIDMLTGKYATDVTTASRTSLMNLQSCEWDSELCRIFEVPMEVLPPIQTSVGSFGSVCRGNREVPLVVSIVDQQASLFGHGCRMPGDSKITFGTGSFALMISGNTPDSSRIGMSPTVGWALPGEPPLYALEGGDYTASVALEWAIRVGLARDLADFNLPEGPSALESALVFVPALSGLGAPYWDRRASATLTGLRQDTTAEDMRRALLEGLALRAVELIEGLGAPDDKVLSVDGGMARNMYFLRSFADLLGRPVQVRGNLDLTALGAAQLGFLGMGKSIPMPTEKNGFLVSPSSRSVTMRTLRHRFMRTVRASQALGAASNQS